MRKITDRFLASRISKSGFSHDQAAWVNIMKHATSLARIAPTLVVSEIGKRVVKRVDQVGRPVDYIVKGEDGNTHFRTESDARAALVKQITDEVLAEIAKLKAKAGTLVADEDVTDEMVDEAEKPEPGLDDEMLAVATTGAPAPTDDERNNMTTGMLPSNPGFDPDENRRRMKNYGRLDGARLNAPTKKRTRLL